VCCWGDNNSSQRLPPKLTPRYMSDRNTQSSPSAMKHSHEENKRRKGKGSVQGAHRQFAAEKAIVVWVSWHSKLWWTREVTTNRKNNMHYRNGREAKNGDKIVKLGIEGGRVEAFVFYTPQPRQ